MDTKEIMDKLREINSEMTEEKIKNASNEELMLYLHLVEKLRNVLTEAMKLEGDK